MGKVIYTIYDGKGNVSELITISGAIAGHYEYDPFGKTIVVTGCSLAKESSFRFSTKYNDSETGLYYYGHRHYQTEHGRWLSHDPIGELTLYKEVKQNNCSLYCFLENHTPTKYDANGLFSITSWFDDGDRRSSYGKERTVVVKKCNIIIYVAHATKLPDHFVNEPCSRTSIVSCDPDYWKGTRSKAPDVGTPLPGWKPYRKPDMGPRDPIQANLLEDESEHELTPRQIKVLVESDIKVAEGEVPGLCKDKRCCCPSITIRVNCDFAGFFLLSPARWVLTSVCGMEITRKCP